MAKLPFTQELEHHIDAACSGLYVVSVEPEEATNEIAKMCADNNYNFAQWDSDRGMRLGGNEPTKVDPLSAIKAARQLVPDNNRDVDFDSRQTGVLLLHNFHRLLAKQEMVQTVANVTYEGKDWRYFVIILAPEMKLPIELEKKFTVIDHELPDREELDSIAKQVSQGDEYPKDPAKLLDAAAGLTRAEAENAFSLSIVRESKLDYRDVWRHKEQMLKKTGMLEAYTPRKFDTFANLGGLENLKSLSSDLYARRDDLTHPLLRPRGYLLLGHSGTGKSQFARCLGGEIGYQTVCVNMGAGMSKYVGESQEQHLNAQKVLAAMGKVVAFIDEGEKQSAQGDGDGGTSKQVFGSWLQFAEDTSHQVIIVATCNNITQLPPEYSRPGRFSGTVMFDLPDEATRKCIWKVYMDMFELEDQELPDDAGWVGAEILDCCVKSIQMTRSLVAAAPYVSISSKKYADRVTELQTWATGTCIDANDIKNPVYSADKNTVRDGKSARSIARTPRKKGIKK